MSNARTLGRAPSSSRSAESEPDRLVVAEGRLAEAVGDAARRLGISNLYPEQDHAIRGVLDGRDVLMVLPTGFGKSACYQIPSMILRRPVVVVSPLLALLRDQQVKLIKREIPSVRLDGTVRGPARREALATIAAGGPLLVMTTPETLANEEARQALARSGIGLAAVDEAHCISEWGHDFRPAYSRIGSQLRELGSPPVLALTATATSKVRETIVSSLGMTEPDVVASSPHRSNLAFEVIGCEGDQRLRALVRLTKRLRRPGIIYCATRREVDAVYVVMKQFGVPTYRYHGKMTAKERDREQKRFMRPRHRPIMVATSAFGLGIDKRDIRYILHFQAPASLEQYVQEAGRAGRDGRRANCILLVDPSDRSIHEALQSRSRVRPEQLYKLGRALAAWAAEDRGTTVDGLALSAQLTTRVVSALLPKLEEAGLAARDDKEVRVIVPAEEVEDRARSLAGQFETIRTQDARRLDTMAEYARDDGCRATFLRTYFGEEEGEPCGLCDSCQGGRERARTFFAPLARPEPPARKGKKTGKKKAGKKSTGNKRRRRRAGAKGTVPPETGTTSKKRGRRRRRPRRGPARPDPRQ